MNKPVEYGIFDPRDGIPVVTTRSLWLAQTLAEMWEMDYEILGEGFVLNKPWRRRDSV